MWLIFPDRIDIVIGVSPELKTLIESILDRRADNEALTKAAADLRAANAGLNTGVTQGQP